MNIDFIGGSYKGYSSVVDAQRCVNFLPIVDKNGGKKLTLQGTPGLKLWARPGITAQDLTTYTEDDANGRLAETATTLTITAAQSSETAILRKSFGAAYFSGNFHFQFDLTVTAASLGTHYALFLSNNAAAAHPTYHIANNLDGLGCKIACSASTYTLTIDEIVAGSYAQASGQVLSYGTTYYCSVVRDEAQGTYGTLYLHVYSDVSRTVAVWTSSLALREKEDFQYLYPFTTLGGGSGALSGTIANYTVATLVTSWSEVRGLSAEVASKLYAAIGGNVYEITTAGAFTSLGSITGTTGPVYFTDNGAKVMLVDGTKGWTIISSTLAEITDGQFPASPTSCAYQDGRFLVSAGSTDDWHISATDDPTSWDSTYESAEGWRDNLARVMSDGRQIWLFGDESFEIWYNAGLSPSPFARIEGTTRKVGLGARASVGEVQGTFFWFTNNRRAVMTKGYVPQFISTPQIEYLWDNYATVSDAIGFARVQEGHILYTLTFPTQNITWEYDALTDLWHELESPFYGTSIRWRANCYTYFNNKHYVGDYTISAIYEVDTDTYTDNGQTLTRIRTSQEIEAEGRRMFFGGLEITGETGVGNQAAPGDDPQMTLDWSDDGGRTWSTSVSVDWGGYQLYDTRAYFRRLGTARKRIFRITFTEQVKAVITGARLMPKPVIGNY